MPKKKKEYNTKKKQTKKTNNTNSIDNKKFIKISLIVIFFIIAVFIVLDYIDNDKHILKPEYEIGEEGTLDNINIKLQNVKYINKETGIELSFEIENKQDNTITIKPDEYFKFYDVNKVQMPNKYENDKNIIKKNEKVIYKLQYEVTKKTLYEIYFYSQIVENNIKFKFKAKDIELDKVTIGGSDKKEEKTIKNK